MRRHALKLLASLLLLVGSAHATVLAGAINYPSGPGINGRLVLQLNHPGINVCQHNIVVPTTPVTISLINGVLTSAPDITPSDCLKVWQYYQVTVFDTSNNLLFSTQWYITQAGGALVTPATGNSWAFPSGLTLGPNSLPVSLTISPSTAGVRTGAALTGTIAGSGTATVTVGWSLTFGSTSYTYVCSAVDAANPTSPNIFVQSVSSTAENQVQVVVKNSSGSNASGTVYCRAHV